MLRSINCLQNWPVNRYTEYKDSGIEWIGEIPRHWIVNRVSRITYVKGRIGWKGLTSEEFIDEGPYLVTGTDFLRGRIDWSGSYHVNQIRFNDDPFIVLQKDDVLITKDGTIGKVAHVQDLPGPATLNSGIFLTRPLSNSYMQRYFYWILNSRIFSDYVEYSSSGTTIQHLYQNVFEQFYLPIPPLPEQSEVSNHLDKKSFQIDSLIEKIERKIELLEEFRTTLINQYVTKGLDPDVEMKDSGIDWIGEIPRHWRKIRIKFVSEFRLSSVDRHIVDGEISVSICHYPNVYYNEKILRQTALPSGTCSEKEHEQYLVQGGDILVTKDSESRDDIGVPCLIAEDLENTVCGYHLGRYRFASEVQPGFGLRYLQSESTRVYFENESNGITRYTLGKAALENITLLLPSNREQEEISQYLDRKTYQIDSLIDKLKQKIELLKEHRQSLISNVVTGKIRVTEESV